MSKIFLFDIAPLPAVFCNGAVGGGGRDADGAGGIGAAWFCIWTGGAEKAPPKLDWTGGGATAGGWPAKEAFANGDGCGEY